MSARRGGPIIAEVLFVWQEPGDSHLLERIAAGLREQTPHPVLSGCAVP